MRAVTSSIVPRAIDDLQEILVHVVRGDGQRLLVVDLQAVTHDGLSVIRAVLLLRALEHTLHDLVLIHLDLQDDVDGLAQIEEHVAQDVRLLHANAGSRPAGSRWQRRGLRGAPSPWRS